MPVQGKGIAQWRGCRSGRSAGDESSADFVFERGDDRRCSLPEDVGGLDDSHFRGTGPVCRPNGGDAATMKVLRFFMTYPGMAVVR